MWWNGYEPVPWMLFGPMIMILLIVGCAVMMFLMMRSYRDTLRGDDPALILKQRFARGEIDKAEYEERRRILEA